MDAFPWEDVALGASVLLGLGLLASLLIRSPHERQRAGAVTVVALAGWLALALAPLPRVGRTAPVEVVTGDGAPRAEVPRAPAPRSDVSVPPVVDVPVHVAAPQLPPSIVVPQVPSPTAAFDPAEALRMAWLAGSVIALVYLLLGQLALLRILRRADTPAPWLSELAATVWSGAPGLRVSGDATRPFCCGVLRPVIVVPQALCVPRLRAGLGPVLRHELAHVRHGDLRTQGLFALATVAFWWHPLLWWLRARTRFAAELVADEVAAAPGRHDYARDLIEIAAGAPRRVRAPIPVLSVIERESDFSRRMRMLLARNESLRVHSGARVRLARAVVALVAVVGTAGVYGRPALRAQEPVEATKRSAERDPMEILRTTTVAHRFEKIDLAGIATFYSRLTEIPFVLDAAVRRLDPDLLTIADLDSNGRSIAAMLDVITDKAGIRWGVIGRAVVFSQRSIHDELSEEDMTRILGHRVVLGDRPFVRDFDALCRMLGDLGVNLREAVGEPGPGKPEQVVSDLVRLLDVENRKLRAERAQLERRLSGGGDAAERRDLGAIADLATRAIDARGDVQTAQSALARIRPLAEGGYAQHAELEAAELRLQTAAAKLEAIRTLVASELEALKIDLGAATAELGKLPEGSPQRAPLESQVRRLGGYVKVLEQAR